MSLPFKRDQKSLFSVLLGAGEGGGVPPGVGVDEVLLLVPLGAGAGVGVGAVGLAGPPTTGMRKPRPVRITPLESGCEAFAEGDLCVYVDGEVARDTLSCASVSSPP